MRVHLACIAVALMVISAAYAQTLPATSLSEAESRALELARSHGLRGHETDAFEAYRAFAKFDRDAIDIHLHFAGMARARLGLVQSRALFLEMGRDSTQSPIYRPRSVRLSEN